MKKLQKIIIKPIFDDKEIFLHVEELFDEKEQIAQHKIFPSNVTDYFVALKNNVERAEGFVVELKSQNDKNPQREIWSTYEIFRRSFEHKIQEKPDIADTIQFSSPWPLYIKEHSIEKLKRKDLIFVDCETTGLYGEYLSFAMLYYDHYKSSCRAYYIRRKDLNDLKNVHPFVIENVIPRMCLEDLADHGELRERFSREEYDGKILLSEEIVCGEADLVERSAMILQQVLLSQNKGEVPFLLAESPYPVEYRFFEKMYSSGKITSHERDVFSDRSIDWHSVKINSNAVGIHKKYQNSIHNALVDVLVNYEEYIRLEGR